MENGCVWIGFKLLLGFKCIETSDLLGDVSLHFAMEVIWCAMTQVEFRGPLTFTATSYDSCADLLPQRGIM